MAKRSRRKGRIRIKQSAVLKEKSDSTRVDKPDTTRFPQMRAQLPRDVSPTFRIKIRRK